MNGLPLSAMGVMGGIFLNFFHLDALYRLLLRCAFSFIRFLLGIFQNFARGEVEERLIPLVL